MNTSFNDPRPVPAPRPIGSLMTALTTTDRRNQNLRVAGSLKSVRNEMHPNRKLVTRAGVRADQMSDASLLAGLADNRPDAALAFVQRFQAQVFRVAFAVVRDRGLAEDVAQQTLERAWRRAASFDPDRGTVRSWLLSIARNLAIDTVRTQTPVSIDPEELVRLRDSNVDDPEQQAIRAEAHSMLRAAVRRLPPAQARAVVMAGIYGLSAHEVAAVDDIAPGTVRSRVWTAKVKLRADLCTQLASNE
jgi:RNA polymerase sigma factor (sigma-70 family)